MEIDHREHKGHKERQPKKIGIFLSRAILFVIFVSFVVFSAFQCYAIIFELETCEQ